MDIENTYSIDQVLKLSGKRFQFMFLALSIIHIIVDRMITSSFVFFELFPAFECKIPQSNDWVSCKRDDWLGKPEVEWRVNWDD